MTHTRDSSIRLRDAIAAYPVISCDVFDTALLRRLARPEDVHLATGTRAAAEGLIPYGPGAYQRYRLEAERAARASVEALGKDEVTLDEICARMVTMRLLADEAAAARLASLEFAVERAVCTADRDILDALSQRRDGQRLVFVSDSILSGDQIAALLRDAGYDGPFTVFSSADARRSKHTGRLFAQVMDTLGCRPDDVVHLGDNPHSDVAQARAMGIKAIQIPRRPRPPEPAAVASSDPLLRLSHSHRRSLGAGPTGAGDRAPARPLHHYVATLMIGFALFVLAEARRRGIRRIHFLARDGYLPFLLAQRIVARRGDDLDLVYLHASRRSVTVPSLADDWPRIQQQLLDNYASQPLSRVLEFIDVAPETTATMLRGIDIDPARPIDAEFGVAEIQRLFDAQRTLIADALEARRAAALGYLGDAGFLAPGPRMVVDVGWRGSIQESLGRLAKLPPDDVFGCYLGLLPDALRAAINPATTASYLFAFGHPLPVMQDVWDGYILMELFFSAPHSSVVGYERRDGSWQPMHGAEEEPGASQRKAAFEAIQAGVLAEFDALDSMLGGAWPEGIAPESAFLDIRRLLTQPSREEVEAINAIPFVQGIGAGTISAAKAIPWRAWLRHPRATIRQIERSTWSAGAARLSLPWPVPSMPVRTLRHRFDRIASLLRLPDR